MKGIEVYHMSALNDVLTSQASEETAVNNVESMESKLSVSAEDVKTGVVEAKVEKKKEQVAGERLINLIKELVAEHLEGRAPSLPFIAKRLGISGRTIQRRLAEEETSFQKLVDDVRQDQALVWVKNGDLTPAEMAFRLGFSQSSSFHRAFKQWTGRSFSQFRVSADV